MLVAVMLVVRVLVMSCWWRIAGGRSLLAVVLVVSCWLKVAGRGLLMVDC